MVQVLPQEPGIGGILGMGLGSGLGEGFSRGMELLLQERLTRKGQQQMGDALEALGLPREAAFTPPALQKELLAQRGKQDRLSQILSLLGGGGGGMEPTAEIETSVSAPEFSDTEILALSQADPNLARLAQSQKEAKSKEKLSAFKETAPYRKEAREEYKGAREDLMRLSRMKELIETGNITNPVLYVGLQKSGLDIPVLLNPDTQEFQKLVVDFTRNARQTFGARVTNFELDTFLKSIPSLLQSEEGKKRVIRNLELLNRGKVARFDTLREILRENDGVPPLDLAEEVENRVEGKLDQLAAEFEKGRMPEEVTEKTVTVVLPDGRRGNIPKSKLKEALKRGAKRA